MTGRALLGEFEQFVEFTREGVQALTEHRDALLRVREGLGATLGDA